MPATPQFRNQLDWWENNKPGDTYGDYNKRMGGWSDKYLQAGLQPASGGAAGFKSAIGWDDNYPDINNPQTMKDLGSWNRVMQSNVRNATDDVVNRTANLGIRGGVGAASNTTQRSRLAAQGLGTVAGTTNQNLLQAMEFLRQKAMYDADAAKLYTQYMGQLMGTGSNLAGLNLQGLQAGANDRAGWRAGAGAANKEDVNFANQWEAGANDRAYQERQRAQQQSALEDKQRQQALWTQISRNPSYVGTGQPSEPDLEALAYLRGPYQTKTQFSSPGWWG